jgi:NAD(P)-dependent dehydrogenase (short-subunit alcohol dehydrogenase family)
LPPRNRAGGGRVAILGAASGIGAAGARALAAEGWRVALLDRALEPLCEVAEEAGAVAAIEVDAADPAALGAAVEEATAELGGLDAAWSNVGIQLAGDVTELSVEDFDRSYAVNLRAHLVVAQSAARVLQSGGSILVTASNSGLQTEPRALAYATTKAAAVALVRGAARDLAPRGIRVNALCPGYVDTPFNEPVWATFGGRSGFQDQIGEVIPIGRMASPEEVAELACFLLSERASYITGHALVADGGELIG